MARSAHPDAMKPHVPGGTRTAAPAMPAQFPMAGRYRSYTLFGATGVLYLLMALVALRVVWALGSGEAAWAELQRQLANPIYVAFHLLCLAAVIFVGVRFFGLFPKAQPAKIGPAKPPPPPIFLAGLYGAWVAVGGGLALVLAGGIF
jgi:fumarate reductase subunit C